MVRGINKKCSQSNKLIGSQLSISWNECHVKCLEDPLCRDFQYDPSPKCQLLERGCNLVSSTDGENVYLIPNRSLIKQTNKSRCQENSDKIIRFEENVTTKEAC